MITPGDPKLTARIAAIQNALEEARVDAWLFCGFRSIDPITSRILFVDELPHVTRRWYYLIPARGTPRKLRHRIEPASMAWWPGKEIVYLSWKELEAGLKTLAEGCRKIAMHYSAGNAVPTVSIVDAGTIEMVRAATGAEIVSSGDLVQLFEARLTPEQIASHDHAAKHLYRIVSEAYDEIRKSLSSGKGATSEYAVQQFIMKRFADAALVTDSPPIVGVNAHSGDPHYAPTAEKHSPIKKGDFVLIDLWAKKKGPDDVMADITWVGHCDASVPDEIAKVFGVVRNARDAAIDFVKKAFEARKTIHGADVDDACREVIRKAGHGDAFIHRTGHSIGRETHGNGANVDNLETRDERTIIAGTCFSIEPGVYLPQFGVRSEVDMMVDLDSRARVTGDAPQTDVLKILG
jgi:Xaa-Pro aminopeptidase